MRGREGRFIAESSKNGPFLYNRCLLAAPIYCSDENGQRVHRTVVDFTETFRYIIIVLKVLATFDLFLKCSFSSFESSRTYVLLQVSTCFLFIIFLPQLCLWNNRFTGVRGYQSKYFLYKNSILQLKSIFINNSIWK